MRRRFAGLLLMGQLILAGSAHALTPIPPGLQLLDTMLGNLNDQTSYDGVNPRLDFTLHGKYNYQMVATVDGPLVYIRVNLIALTPFQLASLDSAQLLKDSNVDNFYYATLPGSDGISQFVTGNCIMPVAGLTAKLLGATLSEMVANMDSTATVWDANLWK